MLSEEEKEAIDFLNNIEYIDTSQGDNAEKLYDSRDIALILINRLQKENKELKGKNKYQYELLGKFEEHIDKETIMKIYDKE